MIKLRVMRIGIFKILFAVVAVFALGFSHSGYGQSIATEFVAEISPKNPAPNAKVYVELVSYSFDINRSEIYWLIGGITKKSGVGEKSFNFDVGKAGTKTSLSIVVYTPDGARTEKAISFRPVEVDILWEAETYVPAQYKGKALPSSGARIKITAFPNFIKNGVKISASRLVYDWEINHKKNQSASGYGKSSFSYAGPKVFNTDTIKATVSDYAGSIIAEKIIKIKAADPKIIFYEENPLEGVLYNSAIGKEYSLFESEISVVAEPFFFSINGFASLAYEWLMNSSIKISPEDEMNKIKLNISPDSSFGSSIISVNAKNSSNILQFAENSFRINYGEIR